MQVAQRQQQQRLLQQQQQQPVVVNGPSSVKGAQIAPNVPKVNGICPEVFSLTSNCRESIETFF